MASVSPARSPPLKEETIQQAPVITGRNKVMRQGILLVTAHVGTSLLAKKSAKKNNTKCWVRLTEYSISFHDDGEDGPLFDSFSLEGGLQLRWLKNDVLCWFNSHSVSTDETTTEFTINIKPDVLMADCVCLDATDRKTWVRSLMFNLGKFSFLKSRRRANKLQPRVTIERELNALGLYILPDQLKIEEPVLLLFTEI